MSNVVPVRRIQLGRELKALRRALGLDQAKAAERLDCEVTRISRIETGNARIQVAEVQALLELYEAPDEVRTRVTELAREAKRRTTYRVPDHVRNFMGLEADAPVIKTYEAELVPGLLQVEPYHRAVIRAASPTSDPKQLERIVAARAERQARLSADNPPQLWFVLNEAVIRRKVGGPSQPEIMAAQLERLLEVGAHDNVSIQLLPFDAGAHAAMGTNFVILTLADSGLQVVYLEDHWSADYIEQAEHVRRYGDLFERVAAQAMDQDETKRVIVEQLEGLR